LAASRAAKPGETLEIIKAFWRFLAGFTGPSAAKSQRIKIIRMDAGTLNRRQGRYNLHTRKFTKSQ
jgi:hypothetical protein